ncbi:MAG: TonB family protein [Bacteroidota bacterium]|nr:TonB family protein [Bacteroidota bacterium]
MKRKKEKVPGFDDIIFRDRNREYGAYDLRRRYGSTMSVSLVAGLLTGASFFLVPYFTSDPVDYQPGKIIHIVAEPDPGLLTPPPPPETPEPPKAAPEALNSLRLLPPEVVVDGQETGEGLLPSDLLNKEVTDGAATDEIPPDLTTPDPVAPVEPEPYVIVQEMPSFPGGKEELMRYIVENVTYPPDAVDNRIQGTVLLRFVVSSTGEVTRVEVTRKVNPLLDEEALRVISGMPRWKPGKQDGNPVPVWFSVPVVFVLR